MTKLRVLRDTVFKQEPIDSSQIEDPDAKYPIQAGRILDVSDWKKVDNHLQVTFENAALDGRRTWYAFLPHVEIWKNGKKIPIIPVGLIMRVKQDTVIKQAPIDSSRISDPANKEALEAGMELEIQSWKKAENNHLKIAFENATFDGKNTWYAFRDHVGLACGSNNIPLEEAKLVREVTSCSTVVVRGLDRQIIEEMNKVVPNALVGFEDLNVQLDPSVWALLQPNAKINLARAIRDRGIPMKVNSGYRTIAQQLVLYNHYRNGRCGITAAALPGRSRHQSGLAIDIDRYWEWRPYLQRYGWRWLGAFDPVHFDYVGGGTRDLRRVAILAFQRLWNRYNLNDQIDTDGLLGLQTLSRLNRSPITGFEQSLQDYRVLRLSQPYLRGEDVTALQRALVQRGFDLVVDGVFGVGTFEAVKNFQAQWNLNVDGVAGVETLTALGLYCPEL